MKKAMAWFTNRLQRQKIHTAILGSFAIMILLSSVLFFALSLRFTERSVIANSREYTNQLIVQLNEEMDSYIKYMKDISSMVFSSQDIQQYLFNDELPEDAEEERYQRVIDQFSTILNTRKDVRNIAVLGDNGKSLINRGRVVLNPYADISNQEWYVRAKNSEGEVYLSSSYIQNMVYYRYDWVITLSRGVVNQDTKKVEGVFLIDLNYHTIDSLCRNVSLGQNGYIYVLDENGDIVYHPQQQILYSGLKTEMIDEVLAKEGKDASFMAGKGAERKVYTMSTSANTGWTVVGVAYLSDLLKENQRTQIIYIILALMFLIVGFLLARVLSKAITNPIVAMDAGMKEVEKGNFEKAIAEVGGQREVRRLGESFNIMVGEIQKLMDENVREQQQKRKAEMRALQAQINPHFLYNTLDSIIWMAESGNHNEEVVRMTSALSRMFRQSVGNEEELVLIEQELDYTQMYLTIQSMRYRDKLSFDIKVEEEILKEKIVKLTLQPLVENAIYHGIKYVERKGKIEIRGYFEEGDIILFIRDNGAGMDEEAKKHIFDRKHYAPGSGGIGVYNVQNRLKLYYGERYGLYYESKAGEGTTVYVKIPVKKEVQDEADHGQD